MALAERGVDGGGAALQGVSAGQRAGEQQVVGIGGELQHDAGAICIGSAATAAAEATTAEGPTSSGIIWCTGSRCAPSARRTRSAGCSATASAAAATTAATAEAVEIGRAHV